MVVDTDPIQQAAESFWRAWSERDASGIRAWWDMDDEECSYLPAESERRLIGPESVTEFISSTIEAFQTIRMRPRSIHPRRLNDRLGCLFAELDWGFLRDPAAEPMGGSVRISGVLRRTEAGWRLCHYAEAPLAPLVELRRFYQAVAADGHEALQ